MHRYQPGAGDRQRILEFLGLANVEQLFAPIPQELRIGELALPAGMAEEEVRRVLGEMAQRNLTAESLVSFLGAGGYRRTATWCRR